MLCWWWCLFWRDLQFGDRFCGHHKIAGKTKVDKPPLLDSSELRPRSEWQPIRVVLDTSRVTLSEGVCLSEGQFVNSTDYTGKCEKASVLDDGKLASLRATFDNMESFIGRMLKVDPERKPIGNFVADLVITVSAHTFPKGDKTLGYAGINGRSEILGRPNRGSLTVNTAYIPEIPQSEKSLERLFFTVMFHEIMHVLGMDNVGWRSWIDKNTGKPYSNQIFTSYFNSTYQKKFNILHTPALHRYAAERFGVSEFAPGVPAGVEIEDGGGMGTAMAHPESRIFMSEVMCGIFVGYVAISNLSLSILDDTGWYEVNYSMAEPYSYGDGKSMQTEPLKEFPIVAPQVSFPKHYLCWDEQVQSMCHHDFRSKAYCSPSTAWSCPGKGFDDSQACKMSSFVNPYNRPVRGARSEFDYLYFKVGNVSARCEDEELNGLDMNNLTGEEYGSDSMCVLSTLGANAEEKVPQARCHVMKCDANDVIEIMIGNQTKYCHSANQKVVFEGYEGYVICPDPKLLCGMKKFLGKDMIDGDLTIEPPATAEYYTFEAVPTMPTGRPEPTGSLNPENEGNQVSFEWNPLGIGLIVLGILLIVVAGMYLARQFRGEPEDDPEPVEMQEGLVSQAETTEERLNISIPEDEPEPVVL